MRHTQSKRSKSRKKPQKPYPSFPLTAHNNGQWCKKIRGKVHFFGVWAEAEAALQRYLQVAADLHAGRQPRPESIAGGGTTVKDVCNYYLTHQLEKVEAGEVAPSSFEDCRCIAQDLAAYVGPNRLAADLSPTDFERYRAKLARRGIGRNNRPMGVHALSRTVTIVRTILKYAYEMDLIDRPIKYGKGLAKPSAALMRKSRVAGELANGKKLFQADDIMKMLDAADTALRAMILLGINGGFGNTDCANLPITGIDFDEALIEFNRPKTGIARLVPLWPETVEALRQAMLVRPKPTDKQDEQCVFLTKFGRRWVREQIHRNDNGGMHKVVVVDAMGQEFTKLLRKLGLKRKGLGFYALRHTFRTWADETRDQHAIHRIMGHVIPGMSGIYIEEISLDRLRAVVNHVREKLFGKKR